MYYDDWEPDYDSLDYHGRAGWEESLYEEGRTVCSYCETVYDLTEDLDDPGCPDCAKVERIKQGIASGELDPDSLCYGCGEGESSTSFLGQRFCWECYQAVAKGKVKPDRCVFASPGGRSALRAAGPGNPRIHPCPTCRESNCLTPQDVARGYQCDACADVAEGRWVPGREY
jgi:hypothetical protein